MAKSAENRVNGVRLRKQGQYQRKKASCNTLSIGVDIWQVSMMTGMKCSGLQNEGQDEAYKAGDTKKAHLRIRMSRVKAI